jgi:hypothetical protein
VQEGEQVFPEITGYFHDGVQRKLNSLPDVIYSIANNTVATHDSLNLIHGRTADTTTLRITYLGKTRSVPVVVLPVDISWTGTVSIDWTDPANWSRGIVPGVSDAVIIQGDTPFQPTIPAGLTVSCKSVNVMNGGHLTLGNNAKLNLSNCSSCQ